MANEDGDEEMDIVDEGGQDDLPLADMEENSTMDGSKQENAENGKSHPDTSENVCIEEQGSEDTEDNMEEEICQQVEKHEVIVVQSGEPTTNTHSFSRSDIGDDHNCAKDMVPSSLSTVPCEVFPVPKSPTPSVSPKVNNSSRKSLRTSIVLTDFHKDLKESNLGSEAVHISFAKPSKSNCLNALSGQISKSCFASTEQLAASLHRGLEIFGSHRQVSALRRSSFRFPYKQEDIMPILPVQRVDVGIQTLLQDTEMLEQDSVIFLCHKCKTRDSQELKDANNSSNMQLVPVEGPQSADKSKKQVPKAVEKVLAGSIRREMALEEFCAKQTSEIMHLNRLMQQYKHERECNAIIGQTREEKIVRLESLMDGILSTEEFMEDELVSLKNELQLLKEEIDNNPEVLRTKIELRRVLDELERYRNFFDMGERDVLLEEIQDLKSQLQYYIDSSPKSARKRGPLLQLTYSCESRVDPPLCAIPELTEESAEQKLEQERIHWTESESKWISLAEDMRIELEASRSLAEKQKMELDMEKKCSEELKEAMQMAMEGHARMLEQYADLEEKHMQMLARKRKILEGIDDVKKAAAKAGVRGAESKFINALAAEISALKVEREKERRYLKDENKGLQAQLRDTAEAVQAAGELLVRLKEAEEAVATSQRRVAEAEQETQMAYKEIDKLKKKHEKEISAFKKFQAESHLSKEALRPVYDDSNVADYDEVKLHSPGDQRWRDELKPFYNAEEGESSKLTEPSSWFSGYDRCNI
ncbi:unnamed protein product [Ilex paraguariensis]|uniref:Kinesin-like protein n=1 Tax=Ilex paraguariensis TaxID=185542 RepID=A0ABC8R6J1_9AQUA